MFITLYVRGQDLSIAIAVCKFKRFWSNQSIKVCQNISFHAQLTQS